MYIVSWNVAGLSTTLARIDADYKTPNHKTISSFENYISNLHPNIDILCIQEHKIPLSQLNSRAEPFKVASACENYESFWSCCSDKKSKGMNGVCTFVRKGLICRADAHVLQDEALDSQGRCIMTDHGCFLLFNVYVPCMDSENKMNFLTKLRESIERESRKENKPVILVGDLNIKHKAEDLFWGRRAISISQVQEQARLYNTNPASNKIDAWKSELANVWPQILNVLKSREIVPRQTTNVATKEKFEKFQVRVRHRDRYIYLGKAEEDERVLKEMYNFEQVQQEDEEVLVFVDTVLELTRKLAGVQWSRELQLELSESDVICHENLKPSTQWLCEFMKERSMIDTFRYFYPKAKARFTCWNQYTNRRYENEGSRIDYILVDKALESYLLKGEKGTIRDDSIEAAIQAATANGLYEPAGFAGGGISCDNQTALDSQFVNQGTSIIYTPPSYSDHVAVSLLLSDKIRDITNNSTTSVTLLEKDKSTKKAQPQKSQMSIKSFFTRTSKSNNSGSTVVQSSNKRMKETKQQPGRGDIRSFCQSKKSSI